MKQTNRLTKFVTLFSLALMLWCTNLAFFANNAQAATYGYRTAPNDVIGVTRPTITFYFSTTVSTKLEYSFMYLNGKSVPVTYDGKGFNYTPTQDLEPGEYDVRMRISYFGYSPIEHSWGFTVSSSAIKSFSDPTTDQLDGLAALNDYRAIYGLSPVKFNNILNATATSHAKYLDDNKVNQTKGAARVSLHEEEGGKAGFTGKSPSDRAKYFGYSVTGVGEDAALTRGTVKDAIDSLFDAPYHRSPILDPYTQEVGVGRAGNYTIILFALKSESSSQLVVSPVPGDRFVPTSFDGNEEPDPLRIHTGTGAAYPVGYPIMAQYYGNGVTKVKLLGADLLDSNNKRVELYLNSPETDDSLLDAVILLPSKPLQADSKYHVRLSLEAIKQDGSSTTETKEWDFTTEPVSNLGKQKLHQNAADYKKFYVTDMPIERKASFGLDDKNYTVDGISFPMKRPPLVVDGSSYLYIRDLAAALGANVDWDNDKRAAIYTKGSLKVTLYPNANQYEVDGTLKTTDTPVRLIDGNTMVPVRLLAEVLGAKVEYVEAMRTVKISY